MHPLKQNDDDVQRILTTIFHQTGYRVDRRDPIIIPYIVQKAMLSDFRTEEENRLAQFTEKTIPAIRAEIEKLERHSGKLMELSRTAATETVMRTGGELNQHILNTMHKADNAVFDNLNALMAKFQSEQDKFMEELEETYQRFTTTSNDFNKTTLWFFLCIVAFAGVVGFLMGYWQRLF